jgi:hypothetical protein
MYTDNWKRINCPFCVYRGETKPDKKKSASYIVNYNGEIKYHCFRCKITFYWKPYSPLNSKHEEFLVLLGLNVDDIKRISFEILRYSITENNSETRNNSKIEFSLTLKEEKFELPKESKTIEKWLNLNCENRNFIDTCKYLIERGEHLLNSYEYYWTPYVKFTRSLILPFFKNGEIVGFTARYIDSTKKQKYFMKRPKNLFFNYDILFSDQEYVFIVEGPFDAISVNGIAVCGSKINREQIELLKKFDKEYIVVPDRLKTVTNFIEVAEENNWWISVVPYIHYNNNPIWEPDIKDCADAVKKYGKLYTIYSLLENKSKNYIKSKIIYNSLREN